MAGKLQVIVGGQYGSEGKGAIAGYLAKDETSLLAIRVGGPNAGHTVYDAKGTRWPLRQVPVAAVTNPTAMLGIGQGSEVDAEVLRQEVVGLESAGHLVEHRLLIDPQATAMKAEYEKYGKKQLTRDIGSTGKGISLARAERATRHAELWGSGPMGSKATSVASWATKTLQVGGTVQIEGTQGYGLGLHAGWYPHCTSDDCTAVDVLGQAGIAPWSTDVKRLEVWVVMRTHPIRIAGPSGPLEHETSWDELGLQPEFTTVTKKERRVGRWDPLLARQAIDANGGSPVVRVALMMLDHWYPEVMGVTALDAIPREVLDTIKRLSDDIGAAIQLVGTGPRTRVDLRRMWDGGRS